MPSFSGQYEYVDAQGTRVSAGPCQLAFDRETFTLAPAQGGPLAFDLGDVDSLAAVNYQLTVRIYTGTRIELRALGKAFETLHHDLRAACRDRFVECLLLRDLEERARYEGLAQLSASGSAFSSPAEIRLFDSNLAVLPDECAGMQWRLSDIDDVRFDPARYAVEIRAGGETLTLSKLAKRTDDFRGRLQDAMAGVAARSAKALLAMLPFLSPDQLARVATITKECRTVAMADLAAVDGRIEASLLDRAAGARLRPYIEALLRAAAPGSARIGFKLLDASRPDEEDGREEIAEADEAADGPSAGVGDRGSGADETPVVFWIFVPLATTRSGGRPGLLAWEATTGSGRATYFFRLSGAAASSGSGSAETTTPEAEIVQFNRALVSLNFRREPIYLDDATLARAPEYRRYLIASRRLPDLRRLRASFAGRAIHSSLDAWQAEVDSIVTAS